MSIVRIAVIGSGSGLLVAALRALEACDSKASDGVREFRRVVVQEPLLLEQTPFLPSIASDDVFHGGGRSKGEKKRAAKARRQRGGY